jgi:hypothetical protein
MNVIPNSGVSGETHTYTSPNWYSYSVPPFPEATSYEWFVTGGGQYEPAIPPPTPEPTIMAS